MQKTERLVAIALLLQARGKMTAGRLADILGVSKRTIYRDVITLSLAHVPIVMDYGPGGGYYLPEDYRLDSGIFTREEAISLILSADMAGNYNLFAGDDDLQKALIKLEAALPEKYRVDIQSAREHILLDTAEWYRSSDPVTFLETLRAAVLGKRQLEILYAGSLCFDQSKGKMCWRRIEPYGIVLKAVSRRHIRTGRWYLVAFCAYCQQFHTFRVSLIEQLRVCDDAILERPDFNLQSYWLEVRHRLEQIYPFKVIVHVTSATRQNLTGEFTVLCEKSDGSAIVNVELETFDAAVSYVLGLGAGTLVLDPPDIRVAVANTARAIADMYGLPPIAS
jgi:predicted DNA-binding transcriptional regulator YafY